MFRRFTCVSGLLGSAGHQRLLRNVGALVVKTRNITEMITEEFQREWDTAKPYEDMPGPKPLPVIGNFWRFLPYIGDIPADITTQQDYLHRKYGDIVKMAGLPGRSDMVMIYDPDEIEKVYRNEGLWPFRDALRLLWYYRNVVRKDVFKGVGGLLICNGEEWHTLRSKVNPTMMQPKTTKLYVSPVDAVATDFIKRIRILRDDKQEMPEYFRNELFKWTLETSVYIVLDKRLGCLREDLEPDSKPQKMINDVQVIFDSLYKTEVLPSFWKYINIPTVKEFIRASDTFTEMATKYINEATERLKTMPKDSGRELTVLEKLLARDPNPKTAMVMALDTIFAGIDTTAYAAAGVLYHLAKNPDKQQKLFEEIHRYLPVKEQPVTSSILDELKYLKACIKESMRLRPVLFGNLRTISKDMVLSNYRIPKKTNVAIPNYHLCRQEKYFAQPDKYIPERWLKVTDRDMQKTKTTHPFVFMPFGFGPRTCVGRRLAELELETLLTKLIREFQVEYNYGEINYTCKLLYTPDSPLKFRFVDRD